MCGGTFLWLTLPPNSGAGEAQRSRRSLPPKAPLAGRSRDRSAPGCYASPLVMEVRIIRCCPRGPLVIEWHQEAFLGRRSCINQSDGQRPTGERVDGFNVRKWGPACKRVSSRVAVDQPITVGRILTSNVTASLPNMRPKRVKPKRTVSSMLSCARSSGGGSQLASRGKRLVKCLSGLTR